MWGMARALMASILAGCAAACGDQPVNPTPLASKSEDAPTPNATPPVEPGIRSMAASMPMAPSPPQPRVVIVKQGDTLVGIAHAHQLPWAPVAAANQLKPPYILKVGSRLMLPDPTPLQDATSRGATPASVPSPEGLQKKATAAPLLDAQSPAQIAPPPATRTITEPSPPAMSGAPPVVAPRNPAAALPLPGDPAYGR
jgi:LysM repeat protein